MKGCTSIMKPCHQSWRSTSKAWDNGNAQSSKTPSRWDNSESTSKFTTLPGKLKLLIRLMWPVTMYELSLSHAHQLERLVSSHVRKWLGLPSSVGLYRNVALSLSISSLVEEYKCAKARLEMTLTESQDSVVRNTAFFLVTGRCWDVVESLNLPYRYQGIMGHVQQVRLWPGRQKTILAKGYASWSRAAVEELSRQEVARRTRAASLAKQGCSTRWDAIEKRGKSHGVDCGTWRLAGWAVSSEPT